MSYQVGYLTGFEDSDPTFDSKPSAFDYALARSDEDYEDFFGVWDEGGDLIAIAHNSDLFRRDFEDFGVHIAFFEMELDDGDSE